MRKMVLRMEKCCKISWTMQYMVNSKTCKQQKKLFEMDIKAKLYATKNIWQWFSRDT